MTECDQKSSEQNLLTFYILSVVLISLETWSGFLLLRIFHFSFMFNLRSLKKQLSFVLWLLILHKSTFLLIITQDWCSVSSRWLHLRSWSACYQWRKLKLCFSEVSLRNHLVSGVCRRVSVLCFEEWRLNRREIIS